MILLHDTIDTCDTVTDQLLSVGTPDPHVSGSNDSGTSPTMAFPQHEVGHQRIFAYGRSSRVSTGNIR